MIKCKIKLNYGSRFYIPIEEFEAGIVDNFHFVIPTFEHYTMLDNSINKRREESQNQSTKTGETSFSVYTGFYEHKIG